MLAHDAIPPAGGTVRLRRDRDMVSVDFDSAGFARRREVAVNEPPREDVYCEAF